MSGKATQVSVMLSPDEPVTVSGTLMDHFFLKQSGRESRETSLCAGA